MQRLLLNNATWWISNDPSLWGVGSITNAEWVDLRNNSKFITMNSRQEDSYTLLSTSENYRVVSSIYSTNTKFLEFWYAGRIINSSKNNFDSNYVIDLWWIIYNAWTISTVLWTFWFIIGWSSTLYKWTYDGSDDYLWVWATGWNITSQTHTTAFDPYSPFLVIQNFIYIWSWNKIIEVDTTWATWIFTDVLALDVWYTIKWITKVADQIFVYATDWSTTRQYLWDWVSTTANRTINWTDKPLQNVANFWNIDYIIIWWSYSNETAVYVVNWIQLDLVFKSAITSNTTKQRIYFNPDRTNAIETIGTRLLIPNNWDVYTYWTETPWLPKALVREFLSPLDYISSMNYTVWNSYNLNIYWYGNIWWVTWSYRINQYLNAEYSTEIEWFIEYHPIYWVTYSNIKNLEKITAWVELEENTAINLYYKPDDWVLYSIIYKKFSSEWDIPSIWDTYTSWWNTYTIYGVSSIWTTAILYATYTSTYWIYEWTYTKTGWSWVASFYSDKARLDYKYIWTITTGNRETFNIPYEFNVSEIAVWLMTWDETVTPKLYDINIYYDENNDD
jgi:hypothetical protein